MPTIALATTPTVSGENWAMYLGSERLVSQVAVKALATEALWLWAQHTEEPQSFASLMSTNGDPRLATSDFSDEEALNDGSADRDLCSYLRVAHKPAHGLQTVMPPDIFERIPHIMAYCLCVAEMTATPKNEFTINRLPSDGLIARHTDNGSNDDVVALDLIGEGRVSIIDYARLGDIKRTVRRFVTTPGDAMVLHNGFPNQRPLHRVTPYGGERLSLII